jgi:hypothetical protein
MKWESVILTVFFIYNAWESRKLPEHNPDKWSEGRAIAAMALLLFMAALSVRLGV